MLSMIDEFDKKKDIHVVDNNGDKRQEWKKKRITPGIKWGHCFYFLWFVSGWAAISTVICTKYLGPDTWSASVNSTNGGKHQTRQCLTQKYRPEKTADSSTRGFPAKWRLTNKRGNSILMTRHYPDPGCASDWSCLERNLIRPIRSTTQIWVITRHQCW